MANDERSQMGRGATLTLAALLAATVIAGSVAIVGIAHRTPAPPPAPAAHVVAAPASPQVPVPVPVHDTQEED